MSRFFSASFSNTKDENQKAEANREKQNWLLIWNAEKLKLLKK
jgi:hypothetical protein